MTKRMDVKRMLLMIGLACSLLLPGTGQAAVPFYDLKTNHWAFASVDWAYSKSIISGYSNGSFQPERSVSESEFLVMLSRYDCTAPDSMPAALAGDRHWAGSFYTYAKSNNLPLAGYYSAAERDKPITRGEVARLVAAFEGYDVSVLHAAQFMYVNGLSSGKTGVKSYADFGADDFLSRAQAAAFLHRLSDRGQCGIVGLAQPPFGKNDGQFTLPADFADEETVFFPEPGAPPSGDSRVESVFIEKAALTANGQDSTYITLTLKDCFGNPIPYEESYQFTASSLRGGIVSDGQNVLIDEQLPTDKPAEQPEGPDDESGSPPPSPIPPADTPENEEALQELEKEWEEFLREEEERLQQEDQEQNELPLEPAPLPLPAFPSATGEEAGADEKDWIKVLQHLYPMEWQSIVSRQRDADPWVYNIRASYSNNWASILLGETYPKGFVFYLMDNYPNTWLSIMLSIYQTGTLQHLTSEFGPEEAAELLSYQSLSYSAASSNQRVSSDGPDVTVKVTAPASNKTIEDEISFKLAESNNSQLACYKEAVTVPVSYVPKAELQVTAEKAYLNADGDDTTTITVKIAEPGGRILTNYNGRVRLYSSAGSVFAQKELTFKNGVASTVVTSISSTAAKEDRITAELIGVDPTYSEINKDIQSERFGTIITHEPSLTVAGCERGELEVAFIIDSSGSMITNDKDRQRVTRSQELITAMQPEWSITTRFSGTAKRLYGRDSDWTDAQTSLNSVGQTGGTNIGAGLENALKDFSNPPSPKQIAILVTDGRSNEQAVMKQVEEAKSRGIILYTIGLGSKQGLNEDLLQQAAQKTGGKYFHVSKSSALSTAYQTILSEVTCGEVLPACDQSFDAFIDPAIQPEADKVTLDTFTDFGCGAIQRVVVRLHSDSGDVDYELIYRGQGYFALVKEPTDLVDLDLYDTATFLAYDQANKLTAQESILITP